MNDCFLRVGFFPMNKLIKASLVPIRFLIIRLRVLSILLSLQLLLGTRKHKIVLIPQSLGLIKCIIENWKKEEMEKEKEEEV